MKKLYVFYINKKPSLDFLNKIKSSLYISTITKESDDCFDVMFKSKFKSEPENLKIILIDLFKSENLVEWLMKIVEGSFVKAHNLSEQNMDDINEPTIKNVFSTIYSCLNKYWHSKDKDIFDFIADVFFKINVTHKLGNGNKRLATMLLIDFLYTFGFYIRFSSNELFNYEFYEGHCIECINLNDKKIHEDIIISQIKNWILRNIYLSANIRK